MIPQDRIQRWLHFYELNSPQRFLLLLDFEEDQQDRPLPTPDRWQKRDEWVWHKYENQCRRLEIIADDRIPFLDTFTGTEIFAQAFGCRVHYPKDDMPFALPCVGTPRQAEQITIPNLEATPLWDILQHAQALFDRSGRNALLRLPDVQTPMDITALIMEKKFFYTALAEEPEVVLHLAQKVQEFQFIFFDEWFKRFGPAFIAHYPDYYMPFGITVSEDEVGAVSSRMFARFFQKELHEMAQRYGKIGIHCCANAEHQWDHFAEVPNLVLLNLIQPIETLIRSYRHFAGCCAQYPSAFPKPLSELTPLDFPAESHFVLQFAVKDHEEALHLTDHFLEKFRSSM